MWFVLALLVGLAAGQQRSHSGYTYSKGACRGGQGAGNNAGLKFYSGCGCITTCNQQASCTGFVEPWNGCGWCETYTSKGASGDGRSYHCYMKSGGGGGGDAKACTGNCAYDQATGACRGGNSPGNNAGLKFYSNRNCKAVCSADVKCTAYVLPKSNSNWCETYTSVGITADGRNYWCYMKNGKKEASPVHCAVSGFGGWGGCSQGCGGGTQTRTRSITRNAANGGNACPGLTDTRACNTQPCPVHCAVGGFGGWSDCNEKCGGGKQTRSRAITRNAQHGGNACPNLTEEKACNTQNCPIPCKQSAFTAWSKCTETCGGGKQTRTRTVTQAPQYGGAVCGNASETQDCNTQPCPVDCEVSEWGEYGECSEKCGGGKQTRKRTVTKEQANGGKECEALEEDKECNTQSCAITNQAEFLAFCDEKRRGTESGCKGCTGGWKGGKCKFKEKKTKKKVKCKKIKGDGGIEVCNRLIGCASAEDNDGKFKCGGKNGYSAAKKRRTRRRGGR